jgi:hypothetical protein
LEESGIEIIKTRNESSLKHGKYIEDFGEFYYRIRLNGKQLAEIAETYDMAMLIALSIKYDGANSKFHVFAARALNIKSVWADG